jgi:hypothetical protein
LLLLSCVSFLANGTQIVDDEQSDALIVGMNEGNDPKAYRDKKGQVCLKENIWVDNMLGGALKKAVEKLHLVGKNKDATNGLFKNDDDVIRWVLKKAIVGHVMAGATSLLMLAHTPISRKVFQYFHCHQLGDRAFLRADYSIECQSTPWFSFLPLVLVVLFGFTILLPGSISVYLFRNREKLYSAAVQQKIGWLYDPYSKGAEFWQVHDVVLKMILTGMLIYIPPSFRAAVAAMVTVASIGFLNYFIPHKNPTLFWLTQVSFIVTCFKYLTALMISAAAHDTNYMSEDLFGYMLVTLDIVFILTSIAACIATVFIIRDKIRKMNKVKQKMKRAMSTHVAKMKSKEWLTTLTHETNEGGGKNLFNSTKGKKSWWATLFVGFVFCLGVLISWCLDFLIS